MFSKVFRISKISHPKKSPQIIHHKISRKCLGNASTSDNDT